MKTVFVIGAGASKEFGLPIGDELITHIKKLLSFKFALTGEQTSGDKHIRFVIQELVSAGNIDNEDIYAAAERIKKSLSQSMSIDNFIDSQRDENVSLVGKMAIVRAIQDAERGSTLYFNRQRGQHFDLSCISNTWYEPFFKLLSEQCTKEEIEDRLSSISFIIFNYDRCFEFYMYHSLMNFYRFTENEAAKIVNRIKIIHPYGTIGKLPWGKESSIPIDFGATQNENTLIEQVESIRTFTEENEGAVDDIKDEVASAERLIFLGFSFLKLNMDLLTVKDEDYGRKSSKVYATAYGISPAGQDEIEKWIKDLYGTEFRVALSENKCYDFFSEYWYSLSFV